ncbi:MAG: bifunctional 4-hydroxy-3-methylbut-2-enyl diphosphate reductase/30S ribosomal protein S1, partial [Oscillospiraceae bacterium]|nr:bifunctional 4-hydroxy-3-methylbut-2-enyl diphosphate reductase/30S ribosomal protein S1 [Oscillospiraceae bacterium]
MREVILAQSAGFCFGVKRAVETVERAAAEGKRAVTLGPIIHNRHVVSRFADMGIREIANLSEVQNGETVIIRSHGVPKADYEEMERRGIPYIDATCPFVERIHKLVREAEAEGRQPIIMGQREHPEVTAIAGWCSNPIVLETPEELQAWFDSDPKRANIPITLVFQTTSPKEMSKKTKEITKKECTNPKIFDTICGATEKRQEEAITLSKRCDAMVVVGDRHSSNTNRLVMICSQNCETVSLVDNAEELDLGLYSDAHTIGITAGASTPAWIIKEVNNTMSEEIKVEGAMEESFAELLEQSLKTLNTGDKVVGIVTSISGNEVGVDLGTKHAGYIPAAELSNDPNAKAEELFKVGDEIEVIVVRVNDGEGTAMLSKKRLDAVKIWDDVEAAKEEKTVIEGVITEENKGGIVANVKGIRVFIPASQTGVPKGGDLSSLVKQTVQLKITEVNRARRRVVGSIREVNREARKAAIEKIWNEIEVGKQYRGVVKSLTSYGAFVDIGGVDGMVHVSELSWGRVKNPAELVKVGEEIDVYVMKVDREKKKISLGCKTEEGNPWNKIAQGDVVTVKIVKLVEFGAFAQV